MLQEALLVNRLAGLQDAPQVLSLVQQDLQEVPFHHQVLQLGPGERRQLQRGSRVGAGRGGGAGRGQKGEWQSGGRRGGVHGARNQGCLAGVLLGRLMEKNTRMIRNKYSVIQEISVTYKMLF